LFKHDTSAYVELEHPAGEAQADFGTIHCVREGKIVEVKSLALSFPRSNAGFAVPMPSENTECFLEGLKRLFVQAGGVPRRLVLDNASAAVASIGEGEERVLTEAFSRFQLHRRFMFASARKIVVGLDLGKVPFVCRPVLHHCSQLLI